MFVHIQLMHKPVFYALLSAQFLGLRFHNSRPNQQDCYYGRLSKEVLYSRTKMFGKGFLENNN